MSNEIRHLITRYPELEKTSAKIAEAIQTLISSFENNGKLLTCGNGGSAADCEHIVGELLKEFKLKRGYSSELKESLKRSGASQDYVDNICGALPAISLVSQVGFLTAFINDANPEYVFAQQVLGLGNEGDVLLALSTSGNSPNIINAAIMAKAKKMKIIGMTGENGGELRKYCDVLINVPENNTAMIQELHLPIYHVICEVLEEYFFAEKKVESEDAS